MSSSQPSDQTGPPQTTSTSLTAVDDTVSAFEISAHDLRAVTNYFVRQMRDGLQNPSLPYQLPAFVTKVPDGSETGTFLSVDLGGTNCRICLVDLHGEGKLSVSQTKHAVPAELMVNPRYAPLFSWITGRVSEFLSSWKLGQDHDGDESQQTGGKRIPLGFTFSFTCEQLSLESGKLLTWDKGWDIPEAIGKDPCAMLQEAIDEMGLPVQVSALANDSVGTLLARAYASRAEEQPGQRSTGSATMAGMIIGTGTNAAYVEQLVNIGRLDPEADARGKGQVMIINTEWGGFDDEMAVLPRTHFDDELDVQSTEPGAQMMEKRVSGMYLGELFRLVVLQLVQRTDPRVLDLALEQDSPVFRKDGIDCSLLSMLADANIIADVKRAELAKILAARDVTSKDVEVLGRVATAIGLRAARLAGAALAAVIVQSCRLDRPRETVESVPTGSESTPPSSSKLRLDETSATVRIQDCDASKKSKPTKLCGLPISRLWHRLLGFLGWQPTTESSPADKQEPASSESEETSVDDQGGGVIDVGVDGSVIEFFPDFEKNMREALRDVPEVGPEGERQVRIGVTQYGSAVGAALMAQAAIVQHGLAL